LTLEKAKVYPAIKLPGVESKSECQFSSKLLFCVHQNHAVNQCRDYSWCVSKATWRAM